MGVNYVTDEVRQMIGREAELTAWDPVERGAVRRFVQAIMDPDPIYWSDEHAGATRYGGIVAPPFYPMYGFRFPPDQSDALSPADTDPHFHGGTFLPRFGLPDIPGPERRLNGGNEIEFYALARLGDRLTAKSRIEDVFQKQGRQGPMVFVKMHVAIYNQHGQLLLLNRQTSIRR